MKYRVVTSMSKDGYEKYGRRMIQCFYKYWPENAELVVYSEHELPVGEPRRQLYADSELMEFLALAKERNACFIEDYRMDAGRFAHKAFALTNPRNYENCDWLIWLDADTETIAEVTEEWLESILPDDADVVYLGRKDMGHSECGFMAFRVNHEGKRFLRALRRVYASGAIWGYQEWHDSYIFDSLRDEMKPKRKAASKAMISDEEWSQVDYPYVMPRRKEYVVSGVKFYNLSEGVPGLHVWDDCPLGEKMRHHKGPLRQKGLKPSGNEPDGYWSQKEMTEAGLPQKGKSALKIKTQNCRPPEEIQGNIEVNVPRIEHWVAECKPHTGLAVICSAGPSLKDYLPQIRELQGQGAKVVTVKHAHDLLIENDIIPWGCMLLDPRGHVQEFIENPHPDVIYFTASMCDPTTVDQLLKKDARIIGYHAHVGAGEEDLLKKLQPGSFMIGGGSTSATRGISVLNVLGFKRYHLFGYDSCYYDREETTEEGKNGLPKWFNVEVAGKTFVTDAELLAQCQDFDKLLELGKGTFMEMEVYGDGMIPHIYAVRRRILPELEEVIGRVRTSRAA